MFTTYQLVQDFATIHRNHLTTSRCLLLAGWDGVRALVAEIHVEDGDGRRRTQFLFPLVGDNRGVNMG